MQARQVELECGRQPTCYYPALVGETDEGCDLASRNGHQAGEAGGAVGVELPALWERGSETDAARQGVLQPELPAGSLEAAGRPAAPPAGGTRRHGPASGPP